MKNPQNTNCNIIKFHIPVYGKNLLSLASLQWSMARKVLKTKIDWFIINKVKEMRIERKLEQDDLAIHLNVSDGFIGHIESPSQRAKYNNSHLNELAKLFKCSPKDFMPEKPL
jgi:DNA-binding XRE family transcriptional regulator